MHLALGHNAADMLKRDTSTFLRSYVELKSISKPIIMAYLNLVVKLEKDLFLIR